MSRIDVLLDDSGDIAMNSFGEIRIAAGMQNLIQALKLKFSTPTGRLLKHPEYGAGLTPGMSTADVRARDIYRIVRAAIEADPRFSAIQRLDIDIKGTTITVSLAVNLANGQGIFPISFALNS
jgi:phage baseplate assembly protein W